MTIQTVPSRRSQRAKQQQNRRSPTNLNNHYIETIGKGRSRATLPIYQSKQQLHRHDNRDKGEAELFYSSSGKEKKRSRATAGDHTCPLTLRLMCAPPSAGFLSSSPAAPDILVDSRAHQQRSDSWRWGSGDLLRDRSVAAGEGWG